MEKKFFLEILLKKRKISENILKQLKKENIRKNENFSKIFSSINFSDKKGKKNLWIDCTIDFFAWIWIGMVFSINSSKNSFKLL